MQLRPAKAERRCSCRKWIELAMFSFRTTTARPSACVSTTYVDLAAGQS
jgi:hypothetical protein